MKIVLICVITVFLQTSMVSLIEVIGKPDFVLLLLTVISLRYGVVKGMSAGVLLGFLEDIYSISGFTTHMFIKAFLGWIISTFKNKIYFDNVFSQMFIMLIVCFADIILFIIFQNMFSAEFDTSGVVSRKSMAGILYTVLLAPLLFKFIIHGKTNAKRVPRI